jgi:hypothetical protein
MERGLALQQVWGNMSYLQSNAVLEQRKFQNFIHIHNPYSSRKTNVEAGMFPDMLLKVYVLEYVQFKVKNHMLKRKDGRCKPFWLENLVL